MFERVTGFGEGFRLLVPELGGETARDLRSLRHWRGLSADDATLLWSWVDRVRPTLSALHTDVRCGWVPCADTLASGGCLAGISEGSHGLRVDAVARVSGKWWVIECKPDAGYVALGQLLTYRHYLRGLMNGLGEWGLGVVTDEPQGALVPVFREFGIPVFRVGRVLQVR